MKSVVTFVKGWLMCSLLWGVFMWFISWQQAGKDPAMAMLMSLYAGLIYQALITLVGRYRARRQSV